MGFPRVSLTDQLGISPIDQWALGCCTRGKSQSSVIPRLPSLFPPIKIILEDDRVWETLPPASPPPGYPPGWSLPSYFVHIFNLAYIIIILLAHSKRVIAKICEIKSEKNTRSHETLNAFDPAKRSLERMRIKPTMVDFRPRPKRAPPAHSAG